MIDYTWTRRKVGTRWVYNPRGLVAGHVIARVVGKALGYGEETLQALSNFRAECRDCSVREGSRLGREVQQANRANGNSNSKRSAADRESLRRTRGKSYAAQEKEIRRWYAEP